MGDCIFDFFVYYVDVQQGRDPDVSADGPTWIEAGAVARLREAAGRLLAPDFRFRAGNVEAGPLLARTLRGGLFTLLEGGVEQERRAVEIGLIDGPHASDTVAVCGPGALAGAVHAGFARVYSAGVAGPVAWSVVERVHGWPLRVLLGRHGLAFTGRRLAALGAEIADALDALTRVASPVPLVHGRLTAGHLMIDVTGRARIVGCPVPAGGPGLVPDAIGLGITLACAALAKAPDPRGFTPAAIRGLSLSLDRPENAGRVPMALRRLIQWLLALHPEGFRPSMAVLRAEFVHHMAGLPMGVPDPAWGRALNDAVVGLPPVHRPTLSEAEWVVRALAPSIPALGGAGVGSPPASGGLGPPRLQLVHGADLPEPEAAPFARPPRPAPFALLVRD
jgi:hypothetical protein